MITTYSPDIDLHFCVVNLYQDYILFMFYLLDSRRTVEGIRFYMPDE